MSAGDRRLRLALLGPAWPFRGGIAHHTSLLAEALAARHDLRFVGFSRMYPGWLYPGASDREPGGEPLGRVQAEPLLDSLAPHSWVRAGRRLVADRPDALILPWWVVFWAPQLWVVSRVARRAQVPVVFLCHNAVEHESAAWKRSATERVLGAGAAFLCQSDAEAGWLRRRFSGRPVVKVSHPSYGALSSGASVAAPVTPPEILFFGFIRPYKGLDVLLEALPEVHARTGATLRVVGEHWGDPEPLRAQVRRLGLEGVVTLELRYAATEEVPGLFARASLLVLPYRSATGCGPLQLAFGAGRPVVGSAVGSIAEAVRDGVDGLLVPPGEPAALSEALCRALEPTTHSALVEGARGAAGLFSWDALVDIIEDVVKDVRRP